MSLVMWVLVALVAGLLAGYVMKRGGYGAGWDLALGLMGGLVVSLVFQTPWVSHDLGMVGVAIAAAVGAGTIVTQRKIWPAIA